MSVTRLSLIALIMALVTCPGSAADLRPPGFRPEASGLHALENARIVPRPGEFIPRGTIVIRDGLIVAVGEKVEVPAGARRWDMAGTTIYAGFIEPYWILESKAPINTTGFQPIRAGSVVDFFGAENHAKTKLPAGAGYTIHGMTPERRVLSGFKPNQEKFKKMRALGFTAANIVPGEGILRGTSSLVGLAEGSLNEILLRPDCLQHIAFEPRKDVYPRSLMGVIAALRQTFYDASHYRLDWEHYRENLLLRPRPSVDLGLAALQNLDQRVVIEPGSSLMVEQAMKLAKLFDFSFAIVACGEEWRRPELAKAANVPFIVPVNFPEVPKLPTEDDWLDVSLDQLRRWDWAPQNPAKLRSLGLDIALTTHGLGDAKHFRKKLQKALRRGLSETDALAALTTVPAKLCGVGDRLGIIEKGRIANLTIVAGDSYFDPSNKVREVWIDGRRMEPEVAAKKDADSDKTSKDLKKDEPKKKELAKLESKLSAREPAADRGALLTPKAILIEHATVWTCGPDGVLTNVGVFMVGDRIRALGAEADQMAKAFGDGVHRIDGTGKHVTPGLIDCHSHTAILGSVNESSLPSTAMVGIVDVINSETETLYEQLAGGLTVVNLLHGSANPIGGRNAVIKLRFGAGPSGLLFKKAPKGIKFALGENVKQSNWGDDRKTRFPQSRMGVPVFHANRFTAAKQYRARWQRFEQDGGRPPRMNLELEVLGEVLDGKRWIHCHSYRQDEMVAFLRTMEEFDIQVGTLQHVLEGYKIVDEIVKHGAGASAFSDWWAYKFEVYDANAYAGALMWQRGALVSFNSDSSELARRMNLEAAKAVKYGGVPETEALKFVTLNPARQLKIDRWVGSLETDKHADFVIWSGHPLAASSLCLETWIEGKQYFSQAQAGARAKARQDEREELISKAKAMKKPGSGGSEPPGKAQQDFFRRLWEMNSELGLSHCLDCQGGAR